MPQPRQRTDPPPRLAEDARRLQLLSSRRVDGIFAGAYRSKFRGPGIEFEEVREYQPGDDVRRIDWNITARNGRPFVKLFAEERELTVAILADRSPSLTNAAWHGDRGRTASEICGLLIYAAMRSGDRVGLTTFSDRIEAHVPPAKGSRHAQRLVAELLQAPSGQGTDLALALDHAARVQKHRAVLVIVSDFVAAEFALPLAAAARRHDVVAISVRDPHDRQLPAAGLLRLADAESGAQRLIDSGSIEVRDAYRRVADERQREIERTLAAAGVEHLAVDVGSSPLQALTRFFGGRRGRQRH